MNRALAIVLLPVNLLAATLFIRPGELVRFENGRIDFPGDDSATRIDFDPVAGSNIVHALDTDWNAVSTDGTSVYYRGQAVVFPPKTEPDPEVFEHGLVIGSSNRYAILVGPDGHHYAIVPVPGESPLTFQVSNSPLPTPDEVALIVATNMAAIDQVRKTLPEQQKLKAMLGTNTYGRLRASLRDTINGATTGNVANATLKNAFQAVLEMDRLERLKDARDMERIKARLPAKEED